MKSAGQLHEVLSEDEEFLALKGAEKFFTNEMGIPVEIIRVQASKSEKSKRAEPGKPGIEVMV
jgi:hypothetical protein